MPFARPSITDLIDRIAADIETQLPGVDARLRRSNLNILARVEAGVAHSLYGYLDWLARQIMPDTAEQEHLERWAAIWGVTRQAATYAGGDLSVTGRDTSLIPANTVWTRADGARFLSTAETVIADGAATVSIQAETAGLAGNTDAATSLSLVVTVGGLNSTATVATGGLTGGYDADTDAELLSRLLRRIQYSPQGGAAHDYVTWALAVPGVTRAWSYPLYLGPGTVGVSFVCDDDDIIPTAAKVAEVQAYIETVRPVTADVYVFAPLPSPINFTILPYPNTSDVRAAITTSMVDMIFRTAEPGGTIYLSRIYEAISIASGESYCHLTSPVADVTQAAGRLATVGEITWA